MGCIAVGIRLRKVDDFPYFSQNGFSNDFLLTENSLTLRDAEGGVCHDENGDVSLECICGLVLSGRTDPTNPIFTINGSFWTNDSSQLLDIPEDQDLRIHSRNRCIHEGYRSMAIIPIRSHREIVGLLQLNSWEKDSFTLDKIHFYEGICSIIGAALMRKQTEEALRISKAELDLCDSALESSNQTMEQYYQLAQEAIRAKNEFLANLNYEIRTSMTAILGYTDLIANSFDGCSDCHTPVGCELRNKNCYYIQVVKRNGEALLGLINNVLDLAKVEIGNMQIQNVRCSPFSLIAEVVSMMRVRAKDKQLKLEMNWACPLPETVLTDPVRFRQVLINVIDNAIKFTDRGEVSVSVRLTEDADCPLLRVDVSDTGIGMSDEQQGMLFKAFKKPNISSARNFSGSGLGLCLSKRLIEALGGDIDVQSAPGKGSTFIVTIDPGLLLGIRMIQQDQMPILPSLCHVSSRQSDEAAKRSLVYSAVK
jgi:signal transduction histidine kinase